MKKKVAVVVALLLAASSCGDDGSEHDTTTVTIPMDARDLLVSDCQEIGGDPDARCAGFATAYMQAVERAGCHDWLVVRTEWSMLLARTAAGDATANAIDEMGPWLEHCTLSGSRNSS